MSSIWMNDGKRIDENVFALAIVRIMRVIDIDPRFDATSKIVMSRVSLVPLSAKTRVMRPQHCMNSAPTQPTVRKIARVVYGKSIPYPAVFEVQIKQVTSPSTALKSATIDIRSLYVVSWSITLVPGFFTLAFK